MQGTSSSLILKVRDHGSGFAQRDLHHGGGLGILNMEERTHLIGGRFNVKAIPDQGVTITVEVPLKTKGPPANRRARKGSPA